MALVRHELALQPGIAILEEFIDPRGNPEVQIEGDKVKKYPQLKEFESLIIKATRVRENNGQISVGNWDIIERS